MMAYELRLFTGNANRPLAEEIAQSLHLPLGDADVSRFSDGEIFIQINENVRGADVFVIQPTCPPVNDTLMELLIMIDALKRASAHRITAVLPYYGYARQDRKVQPRVPISAKLVADLLERHYDPAYTRSILSHYPALPKAQRVTVDSPDEESFVTAARTVLEDDLEPVT